MKPKNKKAVNHTDITVVLDRSGSMQTIANDTIGGYNKFLSDQKDAKGTANITLHQFDHLFETITQDKDVKSAEPLTDKTFVPRGNTALLDAIGRAVNDTGDRLRKRKEACNVVFVIITDGEENHSREFSHAKVMEMIKHQQEKYSWNFIFLGANQDAIRTGNSFGIRGGNSMSYAGNGAGTISAFTSLSSNIGLYRSKGGQCVNSLSFSDDDKKAQKLAGVKP